MALYTRFGDKGKTTLVGKITDKDDLRVMAYGEIDELNAMLGVVIAFTKHENVKSMLIRIQKDLFLIGADLSNPQGEKTNKISPLCVGEFEKIIDEAWPELPPLANFVLPGGSPTAALLHLARTVCRRAERSAVALGKTEKINMDIIIYLNRLSDLLFVVARLANKNERAEEIIWKGKNRNKAGGHNIRQVACSRWQMATD